MTARKKKKRTRPDAQAALHLLVELHVQRSKLVTQANAAWQEGKRAQAKKLARRVVAIETEMEALLSYTRSRRLAAPV